MVGDGRKNKKTTKKMSSKSITSNPLVSTLEKRLILPKRPENDLVLPHGLSYFNGLEKFKFPDYIGEVNSYIENKNKSDSDETKEKIIVTPFTNHEYALNSALEILASEKPRIVFVGESGIDKNGM
ncbi:MAG TPA: hypothetical protein V6C58_01850, partial [Allocoleopsis sp.]